MRDRRRRSMGCGSSTLLNVTTASCNIDSVGEASEKINKSLEEEVASQWQQELADLFQLWDIDRSGFLETKEIGRVVAMYKGNDWSSWDTKTRDEFNETFMKWFDTGGAPDKKLSKEEFVKYVVTEAVVRNPEDPDASLGIIIEKYIDIIKTSRIQELFAHWDVDKSGYLEIGELNQTIALFNAQDSEDWEKTGWPLSGEEKASMDNCEALLQKYDNVGTADKKLDLVEFTRFVLDTTVSEDLDHPDRAFNRVIVKFTELINNTR